MDKCCYLLNKMNVKKELQCAGMLILHVDDILVSGDQSDFYKKALQQLRATFDFGKWDVLSKNSPIKYCGGVVMMREDGKIEVSYEEYIKKICPMTVANGRDLSQSINEQEKSKARGLDWSTSVASNTGVSWFGGVCFHSSWRTCRRRWQLVDRVEQDSEICEAECKSQAEVLGRGWHQECPQHDVGFVC